MTPRLGVERNAYFRWRSTRALLPRKRGSDVNSGVALASTDATGLPTQRHDDLSSVSARPRVSHVLFTGEGSTEDIGVSEKVTRGDRLVHGDGTSHEADDCLRVGR